MSIASTEPPAPEARSPDAPPRCGDIVIAQAREVLKVEFPEIAAKIQIHVPDEKSRRVGQAVAAASLPEIKRKK